LEIDLSYQDNLPDLVDHQAITVYRFVQEGLTNIVKHARATSAWINLDYSDGELNISIEDDGCGFSVQTMKEGVGLRGLRERFLMLNGNFEIETSPNKGTRLSGSIPITS
jgi:signal transduction histidine kinase